MSRSFAPPDRRDTAVTAWILIATLLLCVGFSVVAFVSLDRPRVHAVTVHQGWLDGPTRTEHGFAKLEQTDRP